MDNRTTDEALLEEAVTLQDIGAERLANMMDWEDIEEHKTDDPQIMRDEMDIVKTQFIGSIAASLIVIARKHK